MYKYVLTFSKTGNICYISHLDLMRLFYRSAKKAGIKLGYSKGFNSHPKISFAQPLSLGYVGLRELVEIETEEDYEPADILGRFAEMMPDGIDIAECVRGQEGGKTLAARTFAAAYTIRMPAKNMPAISGDEMKNSYMGQERISTLKKQKKKKEPVEVDIKPMIREIEFLPAEGTLEIKAILDSGSTSNLSPELLMDTVRTHFGLDSDRSEAEVLRSEIFFDRPQND